MAEVHSEKPTQKVLDWVAKNSGGNWRSLLTNLGIDFGVIEQSYQKYGGDTKNACFEMLVYWLKGNVETDEPVSYATLLKALKESNLAFCVSELKQDLGARASEKTLAQAHTSGPGFTVYTDSEGSQRRLSTNPPDTQSPPLSFPAVTHGESTPRASTVVTKIQEIVDIYRNGDMRVFLPCVPELNKEFDDIMGELNCVLKVAAAENSKKVAKFCGIIPMKYRRHIHDGGVKPTETADVPVTYQELYRFIASKSTEFDVFLIREAAEFFESAPLLQRINNYDHNLLAEYLKMTLSDWKRKKVVLPSCEDHCHLAFTLSDTPELVLLSFVFNLKKYFTTYLKLDESLISFIGYASGCTVVFFSIPREDAALLGSRVISHTGELTRRFDKMTHFILFDYFVWDLKTSRIEMLFTSWMQEMEKVQLNSKQITGELMAAEMKLRLKSTELSKAEKEKENMMNATFEQEKQKDRIKRQAALVREDHLKTVEDFEKSVKEMHSLLDADKVKHTLQSALKKLSEELLSKESKLAQEVLHLEEDMSSLQTNLACAMLDEMYSPAAENRAAVDEYKDSVQKLETEIYAKKLELDSIQLKRKCCKLDVISELHLKGDLQTMISELESKIDSTEVALNAKRKKLEPTQYFQEIKERIEDIETLNNSISSLKLENTKCTEEIRELNVQLHELRDKYEKQLDENRKRTEELEGKAAFTLSQLQAERGKHRASDQEIKHFIEENERLIRKHRSLKETISALKVDLEDSTKQRTSLSVDRDKEIEKYEEEKVQLTKTLRARDQEINRVIEENRRLMHEHRKKTEEVEQKAAFTVSQLQAERDKHRETAKKLEEFVLKESVAEEYRAEGRQKLNDLRSELSKERDLASQLKQDKECLERTVAALQQQLDSQAKQLEISHMASLELTSKLSPIKGRQGGEDPETDSGATHFNIQSIRDADETLCPISMSVLIEYKSQMTPHWEALGHGLSIDFSEIQALRNHPCSQESKCVQILEKWFERGTDVSWKRFLGVVVKCLKLPSLVSTICSEHRT